MTRKQPRGKGPTSRHAGAELKSLAPGERVTRPARGAVSLKISLTRHRAFRDGYPLPKPDAWGRRTMAAGGL